VGTWHGFSIASRIGCVSDTRSGMGYISSSGTYLNDP